MKLQLRNDTLRFYCCYSHTRGLVRLLYFEPPVDVAGLTVVLAAELPLARPVTRLVCVCVCVCMWLLT